MSITEDIERKLNAELSPKILEIVDDSSRHAGHAGAQPGGETHFNVRIVADAFEGKSRVARQRMIYAILSEELANRVHALSIRALTPAEVQD